MQIPRGTNATGARPATEPWALEPAVDLSALNRQRGARGAHAGGQIRPDPDERPVAMRHVVIPLPAQRDREERLGVNRVADGGGSRTICGCRPA